MSKSKIHFLDDYPTTDDQFTHRNVADTISDIIQNDEVGKAIALKGSWGSGKSSIVRMVEKNLRDNGHEVFIFDSWAHEGDPLRRVFLESLIEYYIDNGVINSDSKMDDEKSVLDYWKAKLNYLSKREETINTEKKSNPSADAFFLTICTLISLVTSQVLIKNWPNLIWCHFIGLIVITFLPIIYMIIRTIFYNNGKSDIKEFIIPPLLKENSDETITSSSSKTLEPTSIEFQSIFFELMNYVMNKKCDYKLLLIIDNLDRVDSDDAMKIWTTMKGFFEISGKSHKWKSRLWLLVPFDLSALKKLWKDNENITQKKNIMGNHKNDMENDIIPDVSNDNESIEKKNIECDNVISFVEKTFQLQFDTPMPYLSKWHEYYTKKFEKLFGISKSDEIECSTIFEMFMSIYNNNLPPTPRIVKLFLNNLYSKYLENKESTIKLPSIAFYVLMKKFLWHNNSIVIKHLRNESKTGSEIIDCYIEKYREQLAALFFNSSIDDAMQILLSKKVKVSLEDCDLEYLKSIKNNKGFKYILLFVMENNLRSYANDRAQILGYAGYVLKELNLESENETKKMWELICDNTNNSKSVLYLDENSAKGFCNIISVKSGDEIIKKVLLLISKNQSILNGTAVRVSETANPHLSIEGLKLYVTGLHKLFWFIRDLGKDHLIRGNFKIYCSANFYLILFPEIYQMKMPEEFFSFLKPASESNELIGKFCDTIANGDIEDITYEAIFYFFRLFFPEGNYQKIIVFIRNDPFSSGLRKRYTNCIMGIYSLSYCNNQLNNIIDEIMKSMNTNNLYNWHLEKREFKYTTMLMFVCLMRAYESGGLNYHKNLMIYEYARRFLNSHSEEQLNYFEKLLFSYKKVDKFISFYSNAEFKQINDSLLNRNLHNEEFYAQITVNTFYETNNYIFDALKIENFKVFTKEYRKIIDIMNPLLEKEFCNKYCNIYNELLEESNEKFIDFIKNGLIELSKEDWICEINNSNISYFDLLMKLHSLGVKDYLSISFYDFLIDYVKKLFTDKNNESIISRKFTYFVECLEKDKSLNIQREILDEINKPDNSLDQVTSIIMPDIFDSIIVKEKINQLLRGKYYSIIEKRANVELVWLIDFLGKYSDVLRKVDKDIFKTFKDKIESEWKTAKFNPIIIKHYKDLALSLNIKLSDNDLNKLERPSLKIS